MPKKRVDVSLRKPSPTPESAARPSERVVVARSAGTRVATEPSSAATASPEAVVEAFVNGAAAALDASASGDQSAKLQDLLRRGPDGYRELTVYLPEGLARDLSLHCLRHSLDMNRLVAAAVEKHLQAAGLASEHRIRETARLLLDEVTAWVRAAWAARRQARAAASTPTSVGSPAAV